MIQGQWPEWWNWELRISTHAVLRMNLREFTESDLRAMLEDATALGPDVEPGRWVAKTTWQGAAWEVIVEPEPETKKLVVVTAFRVE